MRLRKSIAAIAVVAAGVGVAVEATATPASAEGPAAGVPAVLINESFRGDELHYDFTLLGQAGLTNAPDGSDHAPKMSTSPKFGAQEARRGAPQPSENPEAEPGYLQLTDNSHDKVGGVLYNHALPTSGGLDVSFEHYQYNSTTPGHPADGIGFFISDGAYSLAEPGAFGGSLGYAQKVKDQGAGDAKPDPNVSTAGVDHGYLGIGFDVLGNYAANSEGRGYGSSGYSEEGWGHRRPNTVTLRGPMGDDRLSGYERLIVQGLDGKGSLGHNDDKAATQERPEDAKRLVRVTITPGDFPTVTVYVAFDGKQSTLDDKAASRVLEYKMAEKMPETFKFGFTGSTGDMTDVHLIRNLEVSTLVEKANPAYVLEKDAVDVPLGSCSADKADQNAPRIDETDRTFGVNEEICYRFTVKNTGDTELTNVRVADAQIGYEGTVDILGSPGTDLNTAHLYAPYVLTEQDIDAAHEDGTLEYHNVAVANATFAGEPLPELQDDAVVPLTPKPSGPDPTPPHEQAHIPLPPVGGNGSPFGVAALVMALALTAYLAATVRRSRGGQSS